MDKLLLCIAGIYTINDNSVNSDKESFKKLDEVLESIPEQNESVDTGGFNSKVKTGIQYNDMVRDNFEKNR